MNKKGQVGMAVVIGIVVVVGVIAALYIAPKMGLTQQSVAGDALETEAAPGVPTFCSDNPSVDLQVRMFDSLISTSNTYRNGTIILKDVTAGTPVETVAVTSGGTTTYTTSTNQLLCNHEYQVWVRTDQDSIVATEAMPLTITKQMTLADPVKIDIDVAAMGYPQVKIWDKDNGAYMYDATDSDNSVKEDINISASTYRMNFTSTTDNATNTAVGNSETINWEIELDMLTDRVFCEGAVLGLDYEDDTDTSDWIEDEFVVESDKSGAKGEITGTLSANDLLAFSAFEKFYDIGMLDEKGLTIEFQATSDDSATIDRDLRFKVIGMGDYTQVADTANPLLDVLARDDGSTRTEICTATSQQFQVMID